MIDCNLNRTSASIVTCTIQLKYHFLNSKPIHQQIFLHHFDTNPNHQEGGK